MISVIFKVWVLYNISTDSFLLFYGDNFEIRQ